MLLKKCRDAFAHDLEEVVEAVTQYQGNSNEDLQVPGWGLFGLPEAIWMGHVASMCLNVDCFSTISEHLFTITPQNMNNKIGLNFAISINCED